MGLVKKPRDKYSITAGETNPLGRIKYPWRGISPSRDNSHIMAMYSKTTTVQELTGTAYENSQIVTL